VTAGTPERQEGMRRAVGQDAGRSLAKPRPRVGFVADLVCPWCYIAFARLRRALASAPVELVWRPFLLNPHLPPEGVARARYLERKFGSLPQAKSVQRRAAAAGAEEGISFSFASIRTQPNTAKAHVLLLAAAAEGKLVEAAESLFRGFFAEGMDIGDRETLLAIAAGLGLGEQGRQRLADPAALGEVAGAQERAYALGINGVPVCLFGDDHVVAGAQPAEVVAALLDLELYRTVGGGGPGPGPDQGRHAS
jgi:predicted DsbA family dithiol-disulfide isomerase